MLEGEVNKGGWTWTNTLSSYTHQGLHLESNQLFYHRPLLLFYISCKFTIFFLIYPIVRCYNEFSCVLHHLIHWQLLRCVAYNHLSFCVMCCLLNVCSFYQSSHSIDKHKHPKDYSCKYNYERFYFLICHYNN